MTICLGILKNIYFNMKHSGYFDKYKIPFLNMRKKIFMASKARLVFFLKKYIIWALKFIVQLSNCTVWPPNLRVSGGENLGVSPYCIYYGGNFHCFPTFYKRCCTVQSMRRIQVFVFPSTFQSEL